MHGVHNEANVLLDEAVHRHLMVDSPDPEVKAIIETAQSNINDAWKDANLPKYIQFGKDRQGAHSHSLNGPAFKAVWRHPDLIMKTIEFMKPVWELLETKKLIPAMGAEVTGTGADRGPTAAAKKRDDAQKSKPAPKKQKSRTISWDSDDEEAGEAGERPIAPPAPSRTADQGDKTTSSGNKDESHIPNLASKDGNLTYAQRVGIAFVAFIQFYCYLHEGHRTPAKELNETIRSERGDEAVRLAITMQRGMLALIGTHRRRTYAHDLVYGTYQLYMLFGKPWNAATEGNEHAHQDMKSFFHNMTCHGGRGAHGDAYAVLRLTVVKRQLLQTKWHLLPNSKYAAMRANHTMQEDAVQTGGKKRGRQAGPIGLKMYAEETEGKMKANAARVQMEVVECRECKED